MEQYDKTFKEFKQKALDVLQKYPSLTAFDYIEQCKLDLENFKKYGSFKNPQNETTQSGNVPSVKLERISENSPMTEIISTAQVKVENINTDMPPPTEPLKRNRRKQTQVKVEEARITRSKIKKEVVEPKRSIRSCKTEVETNRDSDIILQNQEIDTVSLSDTDDDLNNDVDSNRPERSQNNPSDNHVKEILPTHNTRSTRSKVKVKENADKIEEISKPKPTGTKRLKSKDLSDSETSVYEDAITTKNEKTNRIIQINSTYVASPSVKRSKVNDQSVALNKPVIDEVTSKTAALANETVISEKVMNSTVVLDKVPINETVVIEKSKVIMDKTVVLRKESPVLSTAQTNNYDDIMTEDESEEYSSPVKHKYKQNTNKNTKPKAIFSPFENSPVKKRVEAFEKLGAGVDCDKQQKIKSKLNKKQLEVGEGHLTRSAKEKTKHAFTPILDRNKIKLGTSTVLSNNESTSIISTKSASALKALYQEHKERELQRKEKEAEAQRKKEALLQAQIEEKRRKREEKQLKVQQSREALGKEKQKTLEYSEKMKEVKYKQVVAEKQEKLAKQREEAEKKRILASKKALEEKRKEKERKNAIEEDYPNTRTPKRTEQKRTKPTNNPKYLTMKAPLLPTEFCYDSDDERATSDVKKPEWAERSNLCWTLMNMHYTGDKIKNTFFVCEATTPDLQDIFENIDPRKLKRTSSAIWLKPPRFTLMPTYFESDTDN